jgi:hypothetical protein
MIAWISAVSEQEDLFRFVEIDLGLYFTTDGKFPDHSGRAVYGMNCLRPLEHWDRGFESHSRHGCLCAFTLRLYSVCR